MRLSTKCSWTAPLELSMDPNVKSKRCDWQAGDSEKDDWGGEAKSGTGDITEEQCHKGPGDTVLKLGWLPMSVIGMLM